MQRWDFLLLFGYFLAVSSAVLGFLRLLFPPTCFPLLGFSPFGFFFPPLAFFPPFLWQRLSESSVPSLSPPAFISWGGEENPNLPAADGATTRVATSCPLRLCPFLCFKAAFYFFNALTKKNNKIKLKKKERGCAKNLHSYTAAKRRNLVNQLHFHQPAKLRNVMI